MTALVATQSLRAMSRAEIFGRHSHRTQSGRKVNIYERDGNLIARGYHAGKQFGSSLGRTVEAAEANFQRLMVELEDGTFLPPSERRKLPIPLGPPPKLTVRQLVAEYLADTRKVRGAATAEDYQSRLSRLLEFSSQPNNLRFWPVADRIDRKFVLAFRESLHRCTTTRNGHMNGTPKPLSATQIFHDLDTARTMFHWARRPQVQRISASWIDPFTPDLVGSPPAKDLLREQTLRFDTRSKLLEVADKFALCSIALSMVFPLRAGEATGLIISEIDFDQRSIRIGTRCGGSDRTKGSTSWKLPLPGCLMPVVYRCIDGRREGPLLRAKGAFEGKKQFDGYGAKIDLEDRFNRLLVAAGGGSADNANDRKALFRNMLRDSGGLAEGQLSKVFKGLGAAIGRPELVLRECRSAITTEMEESGVAPIAVRYLTGHVITDVMAKYVTFNLATVMAPYFHHIQPLLQIIESKSKEFGFSE